MDTDTKKRLVSLEQMSTMLDFMREHPELARGMSRGRRGKLMTVKVWNACALRLNSMGNGAVKDGKGWSKYWCDWKYRVRRHALEIKVYQDTNRMPPQGITNLSPVEQDILTIIGGGSFEGVVVRSDSRPNSEEDSNEEDSEVEVNDSDPPTDYVEEARGVKRRRESTSDTERHSDDNDDRDNASERSGSPPPQRARNSPRSEDDGQRSGSEEEDLSRERLRIEQLKIENNMLTQQNMNNIAVEIRTLTDVMREIRDILGSAHRILVPEPEHFQEE